MRLHLAADGSLEIDGTAGTATYDRESMTLHCRTAGTPLAVRLSGPFGQGYNLAVESDGVELLRVEYHWREGARVTRPGARDELGLSDAMIVGKRRAQVGTIVVEGDDVTVELLSSEGFDERATALAAAVNALYWHGLAFFRRG